MTDNKAAVDSIPLDHAAIAGVVAPKSPIASVIEAAGPNAKIYPLPGEESAPLLAPPPAPPPPLPLPASSRDGDTVMTDAPRASTSSADVVMPTVAPPVVTGQTGTCIAVGFACL